MTGIRPHGDVSTLYVNLCTLRDFEALCYQHDIDVLQRTAVDHSHVRGNLLTSLMPKLSGEVAIYRFSRSLLR